MLTNLYDGKEIRAVDLTLKKKQELIEAHGLGRFMAMRVLGEPKKNGPCCIRVTLQGQDMISAKRKNIFNFVTDFSDLKYFFDNNFKILDAWTL